MFIKYVLMHAFGFNVIKGIYKEYWEMTCL